MFDGVLNAPLNARLNLIKKLEQNLPRKMETFSGSNTAGIKGAL